MLYDFLNVDKNNNQLLYEQLYNNIRLAISEKLLKKGDKLPSVRRLAEDISVSRTTVETAYDQLCAEGYIGITDKKVYYVEAEKFEIYTDISKTVFEKPKEIEKPKFDFSSSAIDQNCNDVIFWQRCIKNVMSYPSVITSYGEPQGEQKLREILSEYSRRVREVRTSPDCIIIGAGTQALLSILLGLCGSYGYDIAVEKGFYPQGEQIFSDFRYNITPLSADKDGIIINDNVKSRIIFVNSSGSIRGSAPIPINKRNQIINWANQKNAIIIEDDFNGELRCMSKPVPAIQGMCSDRVVYIGSFSKLLLPSVRLSYMALPPALAKTYHERMKNYNQTASKIEQLALAEYINCGRIDRRLRHLRKLYSEKALIMYNEVKANFPDNAIVEIIETALCIRIKMSIDDSIENIRQKAEKNGIRLGKCREKNNLKYLYLSFAGIPKEQIPDSIKSLRNIL